MKKRDVIQFITKRCRNLERHFQNLLEDFEVEAIHQFRVEIKKLRAMLRLINAGREASSTVHIGNKVHSIYAAVGELRALQIQKQTVLQCCKNLTCAVPESYLAQLCRQEAAVRQEVRVIALQLSLSTFRNHLMKAASKRLNHLTVENFIAIKKHAVLKLLTSGMYTDEQLHHLRKVLKDFLYLWPVIGQAVVASFPKKALTEQTCLVLAEKLGDFQDKCITLDFFTRALLRPTAKQEGAVLETLRRDCENRKVRLKEQLTDHLSALRDHLEKRELLFKVYQII